MRLFIDMSRGASSVVDEGAKINYLIKAAPALEAAVHLSLMIIIDPRARWHLATIDFLLKSSSAMHKLTSSSGGGAVCSSRRVAFDRSALQAEGEGIRAIQFVVVVVVVEQKSIFFHHQLLFY